MNEYQTITVAHSLSDGYSLDEIEHIIISFSLSLLEKKTEEDVIWTLAGNCISALGFVDCVVYFIDENKGELVQRAAYGPKNPKGQEIHSPMNIPLGQGISGTVALQGNPILVDDTTQDSRYLIDDEARLSEIAVPIKINNKTIGVIDCEHPEKGFFTEQHLRILSAIATICGIKLSNLRNEQLLASQQIQHLEIEKQLGELKAKVLKAQMNPHFVFNALNAIQHFLTENDKKSALDYLSYFSKIVRHYLAHFESDSILLEKEIKAMDWFMKLQHLRYEDKLKHSFDINQRDMTPTVKIPPLITIALLENVIENHIGEGATLNIAIQWDIFPNFLIFTVKYDNLKESESNEDKSLHSWEEHIHQLNALKKYNILKHITNEKNDKGGRQTVIKITVPNILNS